jgi:hypothetical protein
MFFGGRGLEIKRFFYIYAESLPVFNNSSKKYRWIHISIVRNSVLRSILMRSTLMRRSNLSQCE